MNEELNRVRGRVSYLIESCENGFVRIPRSLLIELRDALTDGGKGEAVAWKDEIIGYLQSSFDTEGITENDSGEELIRLSDAIAAVEEVAGTAPQAECAPREAFPYQRTFDAIAWDAALKYAAPTPVPAPRPEDLSDAKLLAHFECAPREAQPVAYIAGADEYGPKILWKKHWVDLIGQSLYLAAPTPVPAPRPEDLSDAKLLAHFECAPREAQPVAWRYFDGEGNYEYREDPPSESSVYHASIYGRKFEPLYLAVPTPERAQESAGVLSDDQIREIWMRETGTIEQESPLAILDFARAVIAANKEK